MVDIIAFLQWYGIFFLIGLITLPISSLIFSSFIDKGYIFSKIIAAITISYLMFVFGTIQLLPFTIPSLLAIIVLLAVINIVVIRKYKLKITHNTLIVWIIEEILFLLSLAAWTYVRGHEPSINGLEKFMDFGFVNSILRTKFFPPLDMWFPPFSINYYYFGHLVTAVLTKLSFVPSNYTYNMMIAAIFAFAMTTSFSIGHTIASHLKFSTRKSIVTGLLSAVLVSLAGNLHVIYAFFTAYTPPEDPVPFWQLAFQPLSLFTNGYWYPNATRFIPNTIHEFPIYSFVVSDLHGHVLDIPIVLLCIAFLYTLLYTQKLTLLRNLLLGFILAVMYMTNVLDTGIYFLLSFAVIGYILIRKNLPDKKKGNKRRAFPLQQFLLEGSKTFVTVLASAALFTLPFSINFKPFASDIGVLCSPEFLTNIGKLGPFLFEPDHCQRSEWWMLLVLYGFFYFFVTILFIFLWRRVSARVHIPYIFSVILAIVSTFLIIIPEFVYVKDIYPDHYRANTMFKLTYQAFIMLSLVSAIVIATVILPRKKIVLTVISFALVTLVLIYPRFAVYSYYNDLTEYRGIDGTAYLKDRYPSDYQAIQWINKNIVGQPVILESQGDSYTDHARISSNTGLPTVLGWTVHEWLWRGSYDVPAPRVSDVKLLYESPSFPETRQLIEKYDVEYIYIGNLEREHYPEIKIDKFRALGNIVYQNDEVTIIKVRRN